VIQDVTGKSIFCNNIPENTSQLWLGFIYGGLVPESRQVIARGKTFRAPADEGDSNAIIRVLVWIDMLICGPLIVGHKALQGIDGDALIHVVPAALKFTWGRADIATYQREGTFFLDGKKRPLIVSVAYLLDVTPDVNTGRAGALTGGRALIRGIFTHDALGR
jgi:hypothetical protein